jgi:hypothetical protein
MDTPLSKLQTNGSGLHDDPDLTGFIKPTDEVQASPRPTTIGTFYLELEYEAAEEEQLEAYRMTGERQARPQDADAARLEHQAEKAAGVSDAKHAHATAARQEMGVAERVLGPYARRPTDAKFLKWARWILLLGGDVVGIAGAALLLGELPVNAFMQALSAAASAVTLGAVGREVRYVMAARFRHKEGPDELSGEEAQYQSWFSGANTGEAVVKLVVGVCAAGALLIAGGIFALRDTAEGLGPAIAFGCLALALGLASFYNSFDTADDVAEHLDARASALKKMDKDAEKARSDAAIADRGSALATAAVIRTEHEAAGKTAKAAVRREKFAALGNSPGVAGNGFGPAQTNGHASASNGSGNTGNESEEE